MIRSISIAIMLSFFFISASAQELKIKSVALLESDHYAVKFPKKDGNNQLCAVLKVYADDLPGIVFSSSFIMGKKDITYKDGLYVVYVADGIKNMTFKHNDYLSVILDFNGDYNINIEGGKTYAIYVETEGMAQKKTQTVAFNMIPRDGIIVMDGKEYPVEKGILQLELAPGKYKYTARSQYHKAKDGFFEVKDVIESQIIPVKLDAYTANVNFKCNAPSAVLFVGNKNFGTPGIKRIPFGKHKIRVVADDWIDYTRTLVIEDEAQIDLSVEMESKPYTQVVIICNGCKTPYLFIDNKAVPTWNNDGKPVGVKTGKHLITITTEKDGTGDSKEKIVRVNHSTNKIVIDFK